ncbi:hypothetical protein [Methylobacterium sp. OAE515]
MPKSFELYSSSYYLGQTLDENLAIAVEDLAQGIDRVREKL